jgi:hypothetical protein
MLLVTFLLDRVDVILLGRGAAIGKQVVTRFRGKQNEK